jgi:hypothetical protein
MKKIPPLTSLSERIALVVKSSRVEKTIFFRFIPCETVESGARKVRKFEDDARAGEIVVEEFLLRAASCKMVKGKYSVFWVYMR